MDDQETETDGSKVLGEPLKTRSEVRGIARGVQSDLHFGLEYAVTKEDLEVKTKGWNAVLIAHANTTFRWTIGLYMLVAGVLLAVLKLI